MQNAILEIRQSVLVQVALCLKVMEVQVTAKAVIFIISGVFCSHSFLIGCSLCVFTVHAEVRLVVVYCPTICYKLQLNIHKSAIFLNSVNLKRKCDV